MMDLLSALRLLPLVYYWSMLPRSSSGMRVLESQIRLGDYRPGVAVSGAQLVPPRDAPVRQVTDLTVCSRVNLKILKGIAGSTQLWYIPHPDSEGQKVCQK